MIIPFELPSDSGVENTCSVLQTLEETSGFGGMIVVIISSLHYKLDSGKVDAVHVLLKNMLSNTIISTLLSDYVVIMTGG